MGAEARLKELGIVLPELGKPVANYLPYRIAGNVLYLAGQGPRDANGKQLTGKLGAEISVEEGYRRARLVGLGLLAAMRDALGSLDRVDFIVKLLGMVNAAPDFNDSPKVINGCSDLFVEVFGDAGRHARSAVMSCCPIKFRSRSRESSRSNRDSDEWFSPMIVIARSDSGEAIQFCIIFSGLLRGACHRAGHFEPDPLARNDEPTKSNRSARRYQQTKSQQNVG